MPAALLERGVDFRSRAEVIAVSNPLFSHIEHFRRNWREEGLPFNWDELPGTGFQVKKQVDLIRSDFQENDTRVLRKEKLVKGLKQTDEDLKGFILEYLAGGLVFPIYYKTALINGEKRIIAPLYGNKKMIETVSGEERNGAVKNALAEKVEPFLVQAPEGGLAVMASPAGWTGMRGSDGKLIEYTESQTYIWQKKGDEVFGFTVRTDFTDDEHREFLRRLTGKELPSEATVGAYVQAIAFVQPENKETGIKEVVDIMRDARFDLSHGSLFAYKDRFWSEVYRDLERREDLWQFDERTGRIARDFRDYALSCDLSEKEMQEALAVTVLRLAKFLKGEKATVVGERTDYPQNISFGQIFVDVQRLPGCAGGGSQSKLVNSIAPRFGVEKGADDKKTLECTCPNCNQKVKAIIEDGKIHCPKCGASAPYQC